ncbi:MAG: TetR/AcrR family transcriptional regulator [Candidatus Izemoplasmatales bacterium]
MEENKTVSDRILEAALIEFGTKGYRHASTNQIYPRAMVSKGSIFKIFGSKAELFYQVFKKALDQMVQELDLAGFKNEIDPFDKIIAVMIWKMNYAKDHPYEMNVLLEGLTNPPEEISSVILSHTKELTKLSIETFFQEISMDKIDPRFSKEDVISYLRIGVEGLQHTIVTKDLTLDKLESLRDHSINFLKTLLKGMEK